MNVRTSILAAASLLWISCGGDKNPDETQEVKETVTEELDTANGKLNEIAELKFHIFVGNIPSPLENMTKMPSCGITFNKDLVVPAENVTKYTTLADKAIAYGMYGSDLGYVTVFDQQDMITDYFANTKSLAEEIGAGDNYNRLLTDRFQKNLENRDSLLVLMDKAIGESEDYLKNNQRLELASLMMVGSWVESQYILLTSVVAKDTAVAKVLYARLPEQKNHLKSLIDILKEQKDNKDAAAAAKTMEALIPSYDKMSADASKANITSALTAVTAVRKKMMK